MESLINDIRYSIRGLMKRPAFSAVVIATLALGIGATTTIFTLVNAVLLKSLPVDRPEELVLFSDARGEGTSTGDPRVGKWDAFSFAAYQYVHDHNQSFQDICAFRSGTARLSIRKTGPESGAPAQRAEGHLVSGNYFSVLGVRPFKGRLLTSADDSESAPPAAVISYRYWQEQLNADALIVGKNLLVNNTNFSVVGVTPPEFFGERVRRSPDLWVPLSFQPQIELRDSYLKDGRAYWLTLMGRLKPGITINQAQAQTNFALRQFLVLEAGTDITPQRQTDIQRTYVGLSEGGRGISGLRVTYSRSLQMLMAIAGMVLLIVCANVGCLFLSRAAARRAEISLRLALGASRLRIIRQLLTESFLLAIIGGMAGVALAQWGAKLLVSMVASQTPLDTHVDLKVLVFTSTVSICAGLLFGLTPAIHTAKLDLTSALKENSQVRPGRLRLGLSSWLVTAQVALSIVLLTGAGLFARSLLKLQNEDLGFNRDNVLLLNIDSRLGNYKPAELTSLYQRLQERVSAVPMVRSVSMATYSPMSGRSSTSNITVDGYVSPTSERIIVEVLLIGPNYAETLGVPMLQGREIGPQDSTSSAKVAVVNKTFVDRYLRNQNPIGRTFYFGEPGDTDIQRVEIVGVIGNIKMSNPRDEPPVTVYQPILHAQADAYSVTFHVRTAGDAASLTPSIREAISQIDSKLPVYGVTTLSKQLDDILNQDRLVSILMTFFGLLALMLASIGLYGVMAHGVVRRTNEIGIRVALGASRTNIVLMVLRETFSLVLAGMLIGIPTALVAARVVSNQLFGLEPSDPLSFITAGVVLLGVSLIAGYLPARRASRVDPLIALRYE
jgi:predicted permease